jgi:hypothetical protein
MFVAAASAGRAGQQQQHIAMGENVCFMGQTYVALFHTNKSWGLNFWPSPPDSTFSGQAHF